MRQISIELKTDLNTGIPILIIRSESKQATLFLSSIEATQVKKLFEKFTQLNFITCEVL